MHTPPRTRPRRNRRAWSADGADALRVIEDTSPDLVVLDLALRTLDGMSVRQEMAARPEMKHIRVLFVTGAKIRQPELLAGDCLLRKPRREC